MTTQVSAHFFQRVESKLAGKCLLCVLWLWLASLPCEDAWDAGVPWERGQGHGWVMAASQPLQAVQLWFLGWVP